MVKKKWIKRGVGQIKEDGKKLNKKKGGRGKKQRGKKNLEERMKKKDKGEKARYSRK